MKRIKASGLAILILALMFISPAFAAEDGIPSIFVGDGEWYRDAIDPLIVRGGRDYVPTDVFGMFDYISVTTPKVDNILIHNTVTGQYVSLLFSNRSAAINGTVINSMGIFMEGETYYVDAETVCTSIGLLYEAMTVGDSSRTVRIFDSDVYYSFYELIEPYTEKSDDGYGDGGDGEDGAVSEPKRIYILCSQSESGINEPQFSANEILRAYGLNYTMFIFDPSRTEDLISAAAQGEYGVYLQYFGDMTPREAVDKINADVKNITHRLTHITLDCYGNEVPEGYHAISADFTVNGVLSANYVFGQITEYFNTNDYCTLYLEDCWNSEQMIILLSNLDRNVIITSNLAGLR